MTMTWDVEEVRDGRASHHRPNVPDGISAEDHAEGLASSLTISLPTCRRNAH